MSKIRGFPVFIIFFVGALFSLMGLPPFGGFLLKLFPFIIIVSSGKTIFLLFFISGALFSLFFYLRLLFNLCFLVPPVSVKVFLRFRLFLLNSRHSFVLG